MSALSISPAPPPKANAHAAPPGAPPSLARFLDLLDPSPTAPPPGATARQAPATPGKPLPDEDADNPAIDPALVGLAPPIAHHVRPVSPLLAGEARLDTSAVAAPQQPVIAADPTAAAADDTTAPAPADDPRDGIIRSVADARSRPEPAAARVPIASVPLAGIETAARVFAQAFHRATLADAPHSARAADPIATPVAAATDLALHAVTATADTPQSALDLRQHDWPRAMIDRIETLRDDANAADTSIRLIPDALGTIDVSLRTEDGAVHVHFAAEQVQTRALLAEAQPRLSELAESRGLKLSQDMGRDAQPQQQHRTPHPQPATPRSTIRAATDTDHRVA